MNFKNFFNIFPWDFSGWDREQKATVWKTSDTRQVKGRIFKLRIQNWLRNILLPHIKKKIRYLCLCSSYSKQRQQYNYSSLDRLQDNLHILRSTDCGKPEQASYIQYNSFSCAKTYSYTGFEHLQNRLANHPLNQYLCSLSDILPKNQFSHHLII